MTNSKSGDTPLKAIREAVASLNDKHGQGGQTRLAELIGKRQSNVSGWVNRDFRVPAEMVIPVEEATGVSRHRLRPDIFGALPNKAVGL